jgi:phosphoribosylanthranilate isomerase
VRVEVKFCGLTREADARHAADIGARYVGVIFAGGPRNLDPTRAREVLDAAGPAVDRVGVFGAMTAAEIARTVDEVHLDIVQLHADPSVAEVQALATVTGARIWAVKRVSGQLALADFRDLWQAADGLVLDSKSSSALGGTGTAFHWSAVERSLQKHSKPLVVAGGLTAANVAQAIEALSPDIVDVSSGVESSPGIKDHSRMAEFMDAVGRARVLR